MTQKRGTLAKRGLLVLLACGGAAVAAPTPDQSRGGDHALYDMCQVWRHGDLNRALALGDLACKTFPESFEIKLAVATLQEVAGHSGESLRLWDEIRSHPTAWKDVLPGKGYLSFPQYRLKLCLGQHEEALKELQDICSRQIPALGTGPREIVAPMQGFVKVEQAVLLADSLSQRDRAYTLLLEAEAQLRAIYREPDGSLLGSIAYRHCQIELRRLEDRARPMPRDALELKPLQMAPLLESGRWIYMLTTFTAGDLSLPESFYNHELAYSSWAGAVADHTPSRTIKATYAFAAGVSSIEHSRRDLALKYFRLSASVDTWLRPVAAAMAAKTASEFADETLKQAARKNAE